MVRLHLFLASTCLASHLALTWASRQPKGSSNSSVDLEQRQNQFVANFCPQEPQKCSECGGDSRQTGFCDDELAHGWMDGYEDCLKTHGEGDCGLICECISDETEEPGSGAPLIIPFPIIPVGFVAPPAAVPNPKESQSCPENYTKTSCEDCEPLEGWCTKGDQTGCPCREECPADDDESKPTCSSEDCDGDDGKCTVGHHKGCKCKSGCPDRENPDDALLICSYDYCKGEKTQDGKDLKCTTNEYKGCGCSGLIDSVSSIKNSKDLGELQSVLGELIEKMEDYYENGGGDDDDDDVDTKPEITCSGEHYSDAIAVDASFLNKLADKFCSGDTSKKRSQDLKSKDISSSAYEDFKFHFELDPGPDCKAECVEAFKSMTGKCQGIDSHRIQPSSSAKLPCGTTFSYKITDTQKFTQKGLQERVCHDKDAFGGHGDVRKADLLSAAWGCLQFKEDKALLRAGSEALRLRPTYGGTELGFKIYWVEDCEGDENVDTRWPGGREKVNNELSGSCYDYLVGDWEGCNNGGAGGYIDYGCVRYDFRPLHD